MNDYLNSAEKQFNYYKQLGEKTTDQLSEEQIFRQPNEASNSIAVIIKHLSGNMLSRWTDFLDSDGEKEWRNRDDEFEPTDTTKAQVMERWEKGWHCLFTALDTISAQDLEKVIYIRNMGHSVIEAINRQLCHYAYHIGQIVFMGKMMMSDDWKSLSVPKGKSMAYNAEKFGKQKRREHFTDDL